MSAVRIVVAVLLIAYATLFAVANNDRVEVDFVFIGTGEHPISVVVIGAAVLGALASALGLAWPLWRAHSSSRRSAREIARLEQEIHGLRTLPLTDEDDEPELAAAERD